MEQFVDLCILCGCDYCDSIKGTLLKTVLMTQDILLVGHRLRIATLEIVPGCNLP